MRSQDGSHDTNTGIWTFNIPEGIAVNEDEMIRIEVINAAIPYSFYNINVNNRKVDIRESEADGSNPVTWEFDFPRGNYNVNQFLTLMETQLTAQSALYGKSYTYNITYDRFLNHATYFLQSPNAKCEFLFGSGGNSAFSLRRVMGFTENDFSFTSSASLTTDSVINMSPYDAIYIHSNLGITNSYDTKTRNLSNILLKVPITTGPFSYIQWENQQLLTYISYRTTIQTVEISIRDMDGNNFNLNNANWYLSVKFIVEPKKDVFQPIRPDDLVNLEI